MINGSVTNLEAVALVLIGRALDGIGSAHKSVPRFQHHPPNKITVILGVLDGSPEVLHQAGVKLLQQKFVLFTLVIIVIEK